MITYTGTHVTREFGAPNLRDIAVQSMRLVRFAGAGEIFWSVGLHSLLVASLLPPELDHHGLLHDSAEVCVNDVPRPMKTAEAKALEGVILARIYAHLGLALPTPAEAALIHEADMRACNAEGQRGRAQRHGYEETQPGFLYDSEASKHFHHFRASFPKYEDILDANGSGPLHFESRMRRAIAQHQQRSVKAVEQYTKAA